MSNITNLPPELISDVAGHLNVSEIGALRHTSKQLVVNTTHSFKNAFSKTTITCSEASLARLAKLSDFEGLTSAAEAETKRSICDTIEHVVIHVFSAAHLVELAMDFDDDLVKSIGKLASGHGDKLIQTLSEKLTNVKDQGDEQLKASPFLRAYAYVRETLIESLNKMPNLKAITVTNNGFNGVEPPVLDYLDIHEITHFDPWYDGRQARLYAYEVVLNIFPALNKPDTPLNLVIDSKKAETYRHWPNWDDELPMNCNSAFTIDTNMVEITAAPPLRSLTLRNADDHDSVQAREILRTAEDSPMTEFVLENMGSLTVFEPARLEFPHLTTLKVDSTPLENDWYRSIELYDFFYIHRGTLQHVEFSNCRGDDELHGDWVNALIGLTRLPKLRTLSIVDCTAELAELDRPHDEYVFQVKYDREAADVFVFSGVGDARLASRIDAVFLTANADRSTWVDEYM